MAGKGSSTFNVSLKLLDQNFRKGISNIQKQIRGLGNFIKGAFALGSITAFGRQMIQVTRDFEDAMARVHAVSNASNKDLQMMTAEAQKLGATTRYTATEAANALENLTRNGMSASQATTALSGTLQLAQANSIGLAEAADIVSNSLNMFGLEAKETTRVNDVLSSVASTTATNISEIYAALVNAAPAAKTLGLSIEETTAAIGALAQRGVKAEQAGTALRTALTKMVDPKIVKKMQDLGISIDEDTIKAEGLTGTIKRLKDANLSLADLVSIFSQRGAVGIQQLIDAYDELELELEVTRNSAGVTQRMFEQGVGTTRAAIDTLKSTYESFLLSLGQKSNPVFVGVINLLTKLIKNFDTLGGTLLNIASVVVPLMTKRIVTMMTTFQAQVAKGIAAATALKIAMGDWVTIIATAVTWIGTYLVASTSKLNKEIKDLNKQLKGTETEADQFRAKASALVDRLGPTTDKSSLAGTLATLTGMFPEFKQQIMEAATEAGETGNYNKLRNVLNDIIDLQAKVQANKVRDELIGKQSESITKDLLNGMVRRGSSGYYEESYASQLESLLKESLVNVQHLSKKEAKDHVKVMFAQITESLLYAENKYSAASLIQQFLKEYLDVTDRGVQQVIGGMVEDAFNNSKVQAARQNVKNSLDAQTDITNKQNQYSSSLNSTTETIVETTDDFSSATSKAGKTFKERIDDIDKNLKIAKTITESKLKDEIITLTEYYEEWGRLVLRAYEDFRDEWIKEHGTAPTHEQNPYYEEWQKTDVNQVRANRQKEFKEKYGDLNPANMPKLQGQAVNTKPAGLAQRQPPTYYDFDWKDYVGFTDSAISTTGMFINTLGSLQSAFDALGDKNATWIEKLSAAQRVMETIESTIISTTRLINELGDIELLAAKKEEIANALGLKSKKKDIAANTGKAVTGAAASQASIPYVGPLLAIAAVATILGVIAASAPKFAKGGIIQGSSKYGDKLLARVNAGEAILNQYQQKRLLDIADGKSGPGGGSVSFHIAGKDLVGVLRNNNAANAKIAGAKGM